MTERPLRLYVRLHENGTREVMDNGVPTGDIIDVITGPFPMFEVMGLRGQFFRIHEALDALEQVMETRDAQG